MADVQKPIVASETGVVEPTPAPADSLTTETPAEPIVPTAEAPKTEEIAKPEVETALPVEEKKEEEKVEEKPVEPISSGALGYKAPGLKNVFRYSKKYFWFGEEPVTTQSLSQYLRGEKAEVAHPTAAWSSQTGKGLLYFVKHADQKESPAGVLNLAEATDLAKDGVVAFHFKLHGGKHSFEAQTAAERNGWYVAVDKAIEDAKAAKAGIVESESYKEELAKLNKPATLAAPASSTPKKSIDATPKPAETEPVTAEASVPARTGSSSSSSDEEKAKKKAAKSKSRSVSRGKRASFLGGLLGKKDKVEEKVEEKKEEHDAKKEEKKEEKEIKKEEETAAPAEAPAVIAAAPVVSEGLPKPAEETKTEETAAPAVAPVAEEKKVEEKPKPTKRGSIFGNFVEKLKSPTQEKKESDLVPAAPLKEADPAADAPKVEEPPVAPVEPLTVTAPEEPKVEEAKPTTTSTPHKEKQGFSFGKLLGGAKEKVKSPSTEKTPEAPKTEEPATTEEGAPVLPPVEPVAEAPLLESKEEEAPVGTTATASATPAPKAKRGSIFGNLTGSVKKEKDGEDKPQGIMGLFRSASKAAKPSKKEKETTATPDKVEETAEPKEEKVTEPEVAAAPATTSTTTEPNTIGDVVPDAVTVGQAPKSTPQVSTTA